MNSKFPLRILLLAAFLLPGCVNLTVNVYFPEPELREAAEEIESQIRGTDLTSSGEQTSSLFDIHLPGGAVLAFALNDREAYAQAQPKKINIDIDTPAIKKLSESRKERYKKLEPYLDSGRFGEGMDAYLTLRDAKGLSLKENQALLKLIKEENEDREALYRKILEANKLPDEQLEKIQDIFFEAIKKTMKPGHYFQIDKKEWKLKPEPPKEEKEQPEAKQ